MHARQRENARTHQRVPHSPGASACRPRDDRAREDGTAAHARVDQLQVAPGLAVAADLPAGGRTIISCLTDHIFRLREG
jgi:hypothetical protein